MKISRIDIVGSNGNDGAHYEQPEVKVTIGGDSVKLAKADWEKVKSIGQYTDPTNHFGEDVR